MICAGYQSIMELYLDARCSTCSALGTVGATRLCGAHSKTPPSAADRFAWTMTPTLLAGATERCAWCQQDVAKGAMRHHAMRCASGVVCGVCKEPMERSAAAAHEATRVTCTICGLAVCGEKGLEDHAAVCMVMCEFCAQPFLFQDGSLYQHECMKVMGCECGDFHVPEGRPDVRARHLEAHRRESPRHAPLSAPVSPTELPLVACAQGEFWRSAWGGHCYKVSLDGDGAAALGDVLADMRVTEQMFLQMNLYARVPVLLMFEVNRGPTQMISLVPRMEDGVLQPVTVCVPLLRCEDTYEVVFSVTPVDAQHPDVFPAENEMPLCLGAMCGRPTSPSLVAPSRFAPSRSRIVSVAGMLFYMVAEEGRPGLLCVHCGGEPLWSIGDVLQKYPHWSAEFLPSAAFRDGKRVPLRQMLAPSVPMETILQETLLSAVDGKQSPETKDGEVLRLEMEVMPGCATEERSSPTLSSVGRKRPRTGPTGTPRKAASRARDPAVVEP